MTANPEPRAVCFPMLKGGFGKSTFVSTLGGILGDMRGHEVLVVDLDPAGHLSTGLGYYTRENDEATDLADVLLGDESVDAIVKNPGHGFDFVPALNLESVTDALSKDSVLASDLKMKQELVDEHLGDRYDYILFDVPGSRNKLTNNAVVAAPNAILPLMPVPEALNGLRETATRLVGPIRSQLGNFEILATVPNDMSARIDHQTKDRKLLESMNTQESFASLLLAGRDGVDARSGTLPAGTEVETVLDNHIPSFARIRADEWEAIDAGEMDPPKPPIRHTGAVGDAYEAREPLPSYDPENSQLEYFGEIADIIERGGIEQ
ncbi:ParA domain protein (plasmid) [Natrialba magadii ATCC 43099]|uniref:ParA domain protein n=2 Tax=Natrialba magadii (strain ATCC 43099 / DSM 3394 / CCM 3739 / CIP 104546 / IAM 13178 / JCM 8861 / NBRC 102185 / NCIMB 2190 / MS3) TaxID=547559 RepID=D3T1P6_NATMM|nr:ParA family protein [Natrialba magadii]ADD07505.1 ParA domain protein [Natrialba magadii ATCC 43099]